jgi:hypothetical protein
MKIVKIKSGLFVVDTSVLAPKSRLEILRVIREKIEQKQGLRQQEKLLGAVEEAEAIADRDLKAAAG